MAPTAAEVQLARAAMEILHSKLDMDDTLAPEAQYRTRPGHEEEVAVALTGRTVPWNTCCLWNVPKLALTGFLLVAEGLHPAEDGGE